MNIELQMLLWSCVLGILHIMLAAAASTRQRGMQWNLSSRGQEMPPLTGAAGRLSRASDNFKETFPYFLAAVVILQLLSKNNSVSALGAEIYLFGRMVYLPLYAFDVKYLRTAVWAVATGGIVLILISIF
jgi:uncharacterized MAPEG superfamily protein